MIKLEEIGITELLLTGPSGQQASNPAEGKEWDKATVRAQPSGICGTPLPFLLREVQLERSEVGAEAKESVPDLVGRSG